MKLVPKYSYEFNCVLNSDFNENEQITNFASTISDKDRFFALIPFLEKNKEFIEEKIGYSLKSEIEFYVVRGEKFKSFSEPITIEYSLLPEEMILFLLKEIIKVSVTDRFVDEVVREQQINSVIEYILINGNFGEIDFVKFGKNLHDESKRLHLEYKFLDIDFSNKSLKDYVLDGFVE